MFFKKTPKAYHLNAPGDFYVEDGMCISCEAPEHEAPDLMAHDETGHCYFKRQPQSSAETDRAILALTVGCCGATRYRGRDPEIIARLNASGTAEACDHPDAIAGSTRPWWRFW